MRALWLRVITENLLNVSFAQHRIDCEKRGITFILYAVNLMKYNSNAKSYLTI